MHCNYYAYWMKHIYTAKLTTRTADREGTVRMTSAPGGSGAVTATELQDWCRDRIADYKVPDAVLFLADLPVNATYKVDTGRLREMAAARDHV
jgi:acyl-CoA synthetase (AMP-forming)/AMP-acid ligase II